MLKAEQIKLNNTFNALTLTTGLLLVFFSHGIYTLILFWLDSPEYGHGILLAGIAGYILWQRRHAIASQPSTPNWIGVVITGAAILLYGMAIIGDIQIVKYYSLIIAIAGTPIALGGLRLFKPLAFPLTLLAFSIPFHPSINNFLTQELQLISSNIGVWFIRLMGMAALQDGNVIDMGSFVMLVEEACSGLRYLLPLASLSLLAAYYYRGNTLIKGIIFLSVVPITVIMNSLRIAVTGVIIKYFGTEAAEGFLHDFEGLVVFAAACMLLIGLLASLSLLLRGSLSIEKNFSIQGDTAPTKALLTQSNKPLWVLLTVIVLGGTIINVIALNKQEVIPQRELFSQFPLAIDSRDLYPDVLEDKFLDILNPDDYFIGDYLIPSSSPINVYMAYYQSQRQGSLIHSPKQCLPAGGWDILTMDSIDMSPMGMQGTGNRAVIKRDDRYLLVYFWINQQGDNFAEESDSQIALIKRSVLYSRTDATLVRVFIPFMMEPQGVALDEASADHTLQGFITHLNEAFPRFLPL